MPAAQRIKARADPTWRTGLPSSGCRLNKGGMSVSCRQASDLLDAPVQGCSAEGKQRLQGIRHQCCWQNWGPEPPRKSSCCSVPRVAAVQYRMPDCQRQEGWFLEVPAAGNAVARLPGTALCCCGYHTRVVFGMSEADGSITVGRQGKTVTHG